MRNQLFDHKLNSITIEYYFDQNVQIDIKICLLNRSFNEIIQKMTRFANLNVDVNVSSKLFEEQITQFNIHFIVVRLSKKNKNFVIKLKLQDYVFMNIVKGTKLYDRKMKTQKRLNNLKIKFRNVMKAKIRKRHFRKTNTIVFESQFFKHSIQKLFANDKSITFREYDIFEQIEIVQ